MGTGAKFLYQFSVGAYDYSNPGSNIVSVTSTAAGDHDKANLTTTPLRETWRSAAINVVQRIVIQANDTTNPIDCFAILNHNFTSDAIVTLEANSFNNFSAPPYSATLTWNEKHMMNLATLGAAYSYFRLSVLDPGNPCGYIEIGKIVGGTTLTLVNDEDMADDFSVAPSDLAYQMPTEGFFRASNERVVVDLATLTFTNLRTDESANANYLAFKSMFGEVRTTMPFFSIIDPSDPYFYVVWGQFSAMPTRDYTINRYVSTTLTIQEVY